MGEIIESVFDGVFGVSDVSANSAEESTEETAEFTTTISESEEFDSNGNEIGSTEESPLQDPSEKEGISPKESGTPQAVTAPSPTPEAMPTPTPEETTETTTETTMTTTTEEMTESTEFTSTTTTEDTDGSGSFILPFIGAGVAVLLALAAGFAIHHKHVVEERKKKERKRQMMMRNRSKNTGKSEEEGLREAGRRDISPNMIPASNLVFLHTLYVGKVHDVGMRPNQQDSFGLSKVGEMLDTSGNGVLAIVADGMGGLSNGAEVSTRVVMSMLNSFESLPQGMSDPQKLLSLLNQANTDVNSMLGPSGLKKSGSTVVAALVRENQFCWITVGDSHIYLSRGNSLILINREHVYGADLDERAARGEISLREAQENTQRAALTSYIGMGKLEKIDRNLRSMQLEDGDRILLMSDGVFGTLSDTEISAAMKLPVQESCEALHQMIQGKGKTNQDNYTAIVLEYRKKNGIE